MLTNTYSAKSSLENPFNIKHDEFYDYATNSSNSVFYDVYLYGRAVNQALSMLMVSAIDDNSVKNIINTQRKGATYDRASSFYRLQNFMQNHLNRDRKFVVLDDGASATPTTTNTSIQLKWSATSVSIDNLNGFTSETSEGISFMDLYKNRIYPIASEISSATISLDILENRDYMWYQFLNALGNTFFDTSTMTPRNSLHHLSILVDEYNVTRYTKDSLDYHLSATYEFNSVIPDIVHPTLTFNQLANTPVVYSFSASCPNSVKTPVSTGESSGMLNRMRSAPSGDYVPDAYWSHKNTSLETMVQQYNSIIGKFNKS
jgi:hypothetical protein